MAPPPAEIVPPTLLVTFRVPDELTIAASTPEIVPVFAVTVRLLSEKMPMVTIWLVPLAEIVPPLLATVTLLP